MVFASVFHGFGLFNGGGQDQFMENYFESQRENIFQHCEARDEKEGRWRGFSGPKKRKERNKRKACWKKKCNENAVFEKLREDQMCMAYLLQI